MAPYRLGLRLYAFFGAEYADSPVQYAQRALDLYRKVNVTRSVDNIDAVTFPLSRRRGGRNRDAALLLLFHPVHRRAALVDFADFVNATGVEQDTLGGRGFTRVNMRHDTDIARILQGELSCHAVCLPSFDLQSDLRRQDREADLLAEGSENSYQR